MTATRTFTEEEELVLTQCLLVCRPQAADDVRRVIDGIIRDGWERPPLQQPVKVRRTGQPAGKVQR